MKNLFFLFVLGSSSLISCVNTPEPSPKSLPIDRLQAYVEDASDFSYTLVDSLEYKEAKVYRIKMISGNWRSEDITNPSSWWHWVDIAVPHQRNTNKALLFIGGGSDEDAAWQLDTLNIEKAISTGSVIAHVSNIPFQPIRFGLNDTIDHYEDDLIAYGWHQFLNRGATDDQADWLLRFPMTRAVSRAMDVVEEVTEDSFLSVEEFFISGASKRGWTTWTTAAVDKRVIGMAPLVIDLLNLKASFNHHYRVYGDWSPAVEDYVHYGIMEWMGSEEFDRLLSYVEPFEFKERFTMPKLIINGTIDEFFVTDSWRFYFDELPGYKQLQYVANGNHGLAGSYNTPNVFSFFNALAHDQPLPEWDWKINNDSFEISIDAQSNYEVALWSIVNLNARDFRIWEVGENWQKTVVDKNDSGSYVIKATDTSAGFAASFVEVTFNPGTESALVFSTGTLVLPDEYPFEAYQSPAPMGTKIQP
jgi:PhoPQ-activated pathogenicity-related protein